MQTQKYVSTHALEDGTEKESMSTNFKGYVYMLFSELCGRVGLWTGGRSGCSPSGVLSSRPPFAPVSSPPANWSDYGESKGTYI